MKKLIDKLLDGINSAKAILLYDEQIEGQENIRCLVHLKDHDCITEKVLNYLQNHHSIAKNPRATVYIKLGEESLKLGVVYDLVNNKAIGWIATTVSRFEHENSPKWNQYLNEIKDNQNYVRLQYHASQ